VQLRPARAKEVRKYKDLAKNLDKELQGEEAMARRNSASTRVFGRNLIRLSDYLFFAPQRACEKIATWLELEPAVVRRSNLAFI
jgi:hypothetical protein